MGDRDRLAVQDRLRDAYAQGALTGEEFEERTEIALRARTRGELAPLVADLPPPVTGDAAPPARPPAGPAGGSPDTARILTAGLGVVLAVVLGLGIATADAVALFSSTTRAAEVGDELRVLSLFGSVQIQVPDDAQVDASTIAILGSAECGACDPGDAGGTVRVTGWTLFGSVEIVD